MKLNKTTSGIIVTALLTATLVGCTPGSTSGSAGTSSAQTASAESSVTEIQKGEKFPAFTGEDFDGNAVDESLFSKNAVTVLNFWFNGCTACVGELSALDKMNEELKKKGAELVGVNVETATGEKTLEEAKKILAEQGASYRNISITGGDEANKYLNNIMAFPTTILVDRNGHIIGEAMAGNIDDEARMAEIMKKIDEIIAAENGGAAPATDASSVQDETAESASAEGNGEGMDKEAEESFNALLEKENEILSAHVDIWNKMFDLIPEDEATYKGENNQTYDEFLKDKLESVKSSLTEEEVKILQEDIEKIAEIERQMEELLK